MRFYDKLILFNRFGSAAVN